MAAAQPRAARLEREAQLGEHPAVIRLAAIFAAMEALAGELEDYLARHPPRCRCACCAAVRAGEEGFAGPYLRDHLAAVGVALRSAGQLCWEQRPESAAELDVMRREAEQMYEEDLRAARKAGA
jgi:hypothetical protein